MILSYLQGKIIHKKPVSPYIGLVTLYVATSEQDGVGYEVYLTKKQWEDTFVSQQGTLWLYHHIIDNNQSLYGFPRQEDVSVLRRLLDVSGVGPKVAMQMLNQYERDQLWEIIEAKDTAKLQKIPGLGAKTAVKVIVELSSDKNFSQLFVESSADRPQQAKLQFVKEGLQNLGYSVLDVSNLITQNQSAVDKCLAENKSVAAIIKLLLSDGH